MTTSPDSVSYPQAITEVIGPSEATPWETSYRPQQPWAGLFGFATDTEAFEFYDGTDWRTPLWDDLSSLYIDASPYRMTGSFSNDTAPFAMTIAPTREDGVVTPRTICRVSMLNDQVVGYPATGSNTPGAVYLWEYTARSGRVGGDVADSWGGARVVLRGSWIDDAPPVEQLTPPAGGSSVPSVSIFYATTRKTQWFGAPRPDTTAVGSVFNYYSIISLLDDAYNCNNVRHFEGGLSISEGTSARGHVGIAFNVIRIEGLIPTERFEALNSKRNGSLTPGYQSIVSVGNQGFSGLDPLEGEFLRMKGSTHEPIVPAMSGLMLRDAEFTDYAITWPGGHIDGGDLGSPGTGALRVHTAFLTGTTAGVELTVDGSTGQPTGYDFTVGGGDIISGDIGFTPIRNAILYDDYGGTYKAITVSGTSYTRIEALTPPVVKGATPSNPIPLRMYPAMGGDIGYVVTGTATTTVHPTQLTGTSSTDYVGRLLEYQTGSQAGVSRTITAYDPITREVTTSAFPGVPTDYLDVFTNGNFTSNPIAATENTLQNGWYWVTNGTAPTPTWVSSRVTLIGDGTDYAAIDQQITTTALSEYVIRVTHQQTVWVMVGSTQGASDWGLFELEYTADSGNQANDFTFIPATGVSTWVRIYNTNTEAVIVDRIIGGLASSSGILYGIRARVIPQFVTINQVWTARDDLSIQPGGGPIMLSGVQGSTSYANDAAAAAGGVAVGQVYRNGSVLQVRIV